MAEDLIISNSSDKITKYESLIPQIASLIQGETNLIANLANICAALKEQFNWFWVGFYLVENDQLVLGPFQGPVACTRIAKGKGVCGTAWQTEEIQIVPDVDLFPGHIACASASRSEIVLPVYVKGEIIAVLDVDSEFLNHYDEIDAQYLKQILVLLDV